MTPNPRVLACALAASLMLAGCGAADSLIEGAVEKGVESATGADVDLDGENVTVTTEDGEFSVSGEGGTRPEGFPESDVPLIAGDIMQTAKVNDGDADGFVVTMSVAGAVADVHAEALALLEAAGYEVAADVDLGGMLSATLQGSGVVESVTLGVLESSEEGVSTVSYTVAMAAA